MRTIGKADISLKPLGLTISTLINDKECVISIMKKNKPELLMLVKNQHIKNEPPKDIPKSGSINNSQKTIKWETITLGEMISTKSSTSKLPSLVLRPRIWMSSS